MAEIPHSAQLPPKKLAKQAEHGIGATQSVVEKLNAGNAVLAQCDDWFPKAFSLHQAGRFDEAEELYRRILSFEPGHCDALTNLGGIHLLKGRNEEAIIWLGLAKFLHPNEASAFNNFGVALKALQRYSEALDSFNRAISLQPNYADAHSNCANTFQTLRRFDDALRCYEIVLELDPNHPRATAGRFEVLYELARYEDALDCCEQAILVNPKDVDAHRRRGVVLKDLKRYGESLASFDEALAASPEDTQALKAKAMVLLLLGDYPAGWSLYERWRHKQARGRNQGFESTHWRGQVPLAGKTILLWGEQGLGDELQFSRYVKQISDLGAKVVLEVSPSLKSLLASLPVAGEFKVVARGEHVPPFDWHSSLVSLPHVLGTTVNTIPARCPYVAAEPHKVVVWGDRIARAQKSGMRVGLAWAGSRTLDRDHVRSVALAQLAPLLNIRGAVFFSLQVGDAAVAELREGKWRDQVIDWTDEFGDFSDTAALVEQLDLVISVDTSVAHLAGALGKRVWLLNRAETCWRWLFDREDSPWYPTLRVFRQCSQGDWESVVRSVAEALRCECEELPEASSFADNLKADGISCAKEYQAHRPQLEANRDAVSVARDDIGVAFSRSAVAEVSRVSALQPQRPTNVSEWYAKAVSLHGLGNVSEAESLLLRVLSFEPGNVNALTNLGTIKAQSGLHEEAAILLGISLVLEPNQPMALCNRGVALKELGRIDEALLNYDKAIALKPDYADAYNNRGNVLREMKRYDDARNNYVCALAHNPDHLQALNCLGSTLQNMARYEEAIQNYDKILVLKPDDVIAHNNRGVSLQDLGRFDESLVSLNRALDLDPKLASAWWNKAILKLLLGDFKEGWKCFEWGWDNAQRGPYRCTHPARWLGQDDIAGKTILLWGEQGLGDEIQFCRYVTQVSALGAKVVLEVHPSLKSLASTLPVDGELQVIARGDRVPKFDCHIPLMSLPLAFGTDANSIPSRVPYIYANREKAAVWAQRMTSRGEVRVGLVWEGNATMRKNSVRNISVERLAPILNIPGVAFYSLQKGEDAVNRLRKLQWENRLIDWSDDLTDFMDTAALVENLDLVIGVDTSVIHLAGAMGKPTWLLNRFNSCWRWLLDRDTSPWYPTLRIFRQQALGDWEGVIAQVVEALRLIQIETAGENSDRKDRMANMCSNSKFFELSQVK